MDDAPACNTCYCCNINSNVLLLLTEINLFLNKSCHCYTSLSFKQEIKFLQKFIFVISDDSSWQDSSSIDF